MPSPKKHSDRAPITPAAYRSGVEAPATAARTAHRRSRSLHEPAGPLDPLTSVRRRLDSASPAKIAPRDPITPRVRSGMAVPNSKRVSLSAGALPTTANASHKKMLLPQTAPREPPTSLARSKSVERRTRLLLADGSPALPDHRLDSKRGLSTPAALASKRSIPPEEVVHRPEVGPVSRIRNLSSRLRPDALAQPALRHRTGSVPAAVVAAPKVSTEIAARQRTLSRPTTGIRPSASTTSLASSGATAPRSIRPATTRALPRKGREFGKDSMAVTNRLSRPTTASTASLASKRSIESKLSTDQTVASPSKRADPVTLKSRGASTPATSTLAKSRPTSIVSTSTRPTLSVASRPASLVSPMGNAIPAEASKRSMLPPSARERTSALPRPGAGSATSRLPTNGTSSGAAGFDDLKARLNKLSMRQQAGRAAK